MIIVMRKKVTFENRGRWISKRQTYYYFLMSKKILQKMHYIPQR